MVKTAKKTKELKKKVIKKSEKKVEKVEKKVVEKTEKLPEAKQQIIDKFSQHKGDTGSPEVQIALLSQKIIRLSEHLATNKKDNHSRRGLLKVIAKRRRILNYLQKLDEKRYKILLKELGLKK
jgi:small subunit ribosomal protein S15